LPLINIYRVTNGYRNFLVSLRSISVGGDFMLCIWAKAGLTMKSKLIKKNRIIIRPKLMVSARSVNNGS
jgi:hypothetical protein